MPTSDHQEPLEPVRERAATVAPTPWPVLITGETGTGKTWLAEQIHEMSGRRGRFVVINCAAVPATLLESQLFGYRAGAFTGADRDTPGLFETADGGTLFLDEIGDMAIEAQAKLLRVVESGRVRRIGAADEQTVDVRIVCATNEHLEARVDEKLFRRDLLYRINSFQLHLPPLRERQAEIPAFVDHFLRDVAGGADVAVTDAAIRRLQEHSWPGNLRELQSVLRQAFVASGGGTLEPKHLPRLDTRLPDDASDDDGDSTAARLREALAGRTREAWARFLLALVDEAGSNRFSRKHILPVLQRVHGDRKTEHALDTMWRREIRDLIEATQLVARSKNQLFVDAAACHAVLAETGSPTDRPAGGGTSPVSGPSPARARPPLPRRPLPLVGRAADLDALADRVIDESLVTLVGTGGVGKTAVAIEVAHRLAPRFPGGCAFVDLSNHTTAADIVDAVITALQLAIDGDERADALATVLAGGDQRLLVLDNFEHVAAHATDTVALWASPNTHLLVTSRRVLHARGERVVDLQPLPTTGPDTPAVRLFVERARAARPTAAPTDNQLPTVAAICQQLDGIPLAIELAAGRVRSMSLDQILARMENRLDLLRRPGADGDVSRHATLSAVLDWSFSLLRESEQHLLMSLTVFHGAFTLDAAEAVAGDDAADGLATLVDHSLVKFDDSGAEPAFVMLGTVREFAAAKAAETLADDQRRELADRHAAYFARTGYDRFLDSRRGGPDGWLSIRALARADANLAAAAAHAAMIADGPGLARLTLARAVTMRGGVRVCQTSIVDALEQPLDDPLLQLWLELYRLRVGAFMSAEGDAINTLTDLITRIDALPGGRSAHADLATDALYLRAWYEQTYRHLARAVDDATAAVNIHNRHGNAAGTARMMSVLAHCLYEAGDRDGAAHQISEARRIAGALRGPCSEQCHVLGVSATHAAGRGDLAAAIEQTRQAIAISEEIGARLVTVHHTNQLADFLLQSGQLADALVAADDAVRLSLATGSARFISLAERNRARVHLAQNEPEQALAMLVNLPDNVYAGGLYRGIALAMAGMDRDGATTVLRTFLDGQTQPDLTFIALAWIAVATSDPADSQRARDRALEHGFTADHWNFEVAEAARRVSVS